MGDRAYGEGRYAQALAEYRAALSGNPGGRVRAKAGSAALHTGNLEQAMRLYLELAADDPTRADEAAEGLETVVRAAERAGKGDVVREGVTGLRAIAPDRVTGRYAVLLAQQQGLESATLAALIPAAIAGAGDAATIDSLLGVYGDALKTTAGCGQAVFPYRAAVRRATDSSVRARARNGLAGCALLLGRKAQGAGSLEEAALWFAEAARVDSTSPTGREALVRYGDARALQGDTIAAALAFQAVVSAGQADSLAQVAAARLQALGHSR
jgi:tetratricopeptide (TPR) repeat protein